MLAEVGFNWAVTRCQWRRIFDWRWFFFFFFLVGFQLKVGGWRWVFSGRVLGRLKVSFFCWVFGWRWVFGGRGFWLKVSFWLNGFLFEARFSIEGGAFALVVVSMGGGDEGFGLVIGWGSWWVAEDFAGVWLDLFGLGFGWDLFGSWRI